MAALENFRAGRCQMDMLNKAYIVLLPKVQGTEQIRDFLPISLSNSFFFLKRRKKGPQNGNPPVAIELMAESTK